MDFQFFFLENKKYIMKSTNLAYLKTRGGFQGSFNPRRKFPYPEATDMSTYYNIQLLFG